MSIESLDTRLAELETLAENLAAGIAVARLELAELDPPEEPEPLLVPGVPGRFRAAFTPAGLECEWDAPSTGGAPDGYTLNVEGV